MAVIKKADVDAEFERQLRDALRDESVVQRYMRDDVGLPWVVVIWPELMQR